MQNQVIWAPSSRPLHRGGFALGRRGALIGRLIGGSELSFVRVAPGRWTQADPLLPSGPLYRVASAGARGGAGDRRRARLPL